MVRIGRGFLVEVSRLEALCVVNEFLNELTVHWQAFENGVGRSCGHHVGHSDVNIDKEVWPSESNVAVGSEEVVVHAVPPEF